MNDSNRVHEKQSAGTNLGKWRSALISVSVAGLLSAAPLAHASTQASGAQTGLQQAWTNTMSQPVLQISGGTSFSEQYVDQGGTTQRQSESDTFTAQLETDGGGFDELLKDSATGTFGSNSTLFILPDDTFYYQQGKSWPKGGTISSNTLQEEAPLLQDLGNLAATPTSDGLVTYKGTLTASQVVSLIDNYIMMGQSNTAYDSLSDHILNESKSLVTVTTSTFNGKPVVEEVQMDLTVALSLADTIKVLGVSGDTSKVGPEQISFSYDFKNTFSQMTFPSPITGKTPAVQLVTQGGTSQGDASNSQGATLNGGTGSASTSDTGASGGSTAKTTATHLSTDEVNKAFQNAFGRNATSDELTRWTGAGNLGYSSLLQDLRKIIKASAAARKSNILLAYWNSFGRAPDAAELQYWDNRLKSTGELYVEEMAVNRKYIQGDGNVRQFIIDKAYTSVFWRGPNAGDMKYWDGVLRSSGTDFQELLAANQTSFHSMSVMREGAVNNAYLVYLCLQPGRSNLQAWSNIIQSHSLKSYSELMKYMDPTLRHDIETNESIRKYIISSAYWTVFWRGPNSGELKYWDSLLKNKGYNFQELVNNNIDFLRTNDQMRTAAINNAFMVMIGRNAATSELHAWSQQFANGSVHTYQNLVNEIKSSVKENSAVEADIIDRAYAACFGRHAKPAEVRYWEQYFKSGQVDYSTLVKLNRDYVKRDAATRSEMIRMSYEQVFHREPTSGEFNFWDNALKKYGDVYTELVSAHRIWLQANQAVLAANDALKSDLVRKGLKFDSKTGNLVDIKTGRVVLSSNDWIIATKDQNGNLVGIGGTGVIAAGSGNVIAAGGGNVIAAGSGNVIAAGSGNVIAAGSGNVIAAGSGNVIAAGSGNMIQIDGGALSNPGMIALNAGAGVITAGGGNVISAGGGN